MEKMQALFYFNRIIQFFGEHALFAGKRELRVPVLHALSLGVDIKMGRARLLCFANAKCREIGKGDFLALTNLGIREPSGVTRPRHFVFRC